jgi:hypothetical protein
MKRVWIDERPDSLAPGSHLGTGCDVFLMTWSRAYSCMQTGKDRDDQPDFLKEARC